MTVLIVMRCSFQSKKTLISMTFSLTMM